MRGPSWIGFGLGLSLTNLFPSLPFPSFPCGRQQTEDGREDRGCSEKHLVDANIVDHVTYLGYPFTLTYLNCAIPKPGERGASQS